MAKLVQIHPNQYRLTAKIQLTPKAESLNQPVIQASYLAFVLYGRYWIRTSDPFRVKEVRYHCANRPKLRRAVQITSYLVWNRYAIGLNGCQKSS